MEIKKTFRLLALALSLLMIERSMASRTLAENNPPPDMDGSRFLPSGSVAPRDGSHNGDSLDQGMVLVPPPTKKTTMSQAGAPDKSASAVVVSPTDAKVNVSTAVSPTSATSEASVTSSSYASSTASASSFSTVSESSSATFTKFP
ncbi:uncharacterized protein LOC115669145 [Syzygium oleosum]|uniref:uncharacterized protein LOC115669145 n=1 Tax=Syzygium oleosum TaxID=219896 RepID=UPI0024BB2712|nr:uncharacterized protein LOC115669145 [Syzygium oleosum]